MWVPWSNALPRTRAARLARALASHPGWDAAATAAAAATPAGLRPTPVTAAAEQYRALQLFSVREPEAFWSAVIARLGVVFHASPRRVLAEDGGSSGPWLEGARLNVAESVFANRNPAAVAVVWAGEGDGGRVRQWTLGDLRRRASHVGHALVAAGVERGAGVGVCLPMTAEAVAVFLGVVLVGCHVVGIADSFSAAEIAVRLRLGGAVACVTQDAVLRGGKALPLYDRVRQAARSVPAPGCRVVVLAARAPSGLAPEALAEFAPRCDLDRGNGDMAYTELLAGGSRAELRATPAAAGATTTVLFSSGTTGEPKAIPWDHSHPLKAAADGMLHQDIGEGDVVAWPTSLGWMMGPWLIYAALLNGAAVALFDGSPLSRPFGAFVRDARVTMLGLVPSIVKAWRRTGCMAGLDWSSLRCFSSTGEASNPEDSHWLSARVRGYRPVVEYCGGTELAGGYITGSLAQPQAPSAFSTPAMGADLRLLDAEQRLLPATGAEEGEVRPPALVGRGVPGMTDQRRSLDPGGDPAADVRGVAPAAQPRPRLRVLPRDAGGRGRAAAAAARRRAGAARGRVLARHRPHGRRHEPRRDQDQRPRARGRRRRRAPTRGRGRGRCRRARGRRALRPLARRGLGPGGCAGWGRGQEAGGRAAGDVPAGALGEAQPAVPRARGAAPPRTPPHRLRQGPAPQAARGVPAP